MKDKKYYFIGDIHGCKSELELLIQKLKLTPIDEVYAVGDLVNKGPDSNGVVDLIRKNNIKAVMGNHDLIIREIYNYEKFGNIPQFKIKKKHQELYESLSAENKAFIAQLPFYIIIEEIKTIVVHAGIKPGTNLNAHTDEEITCLRIVDPVTKEFVRRDQFGLPWYFYYESDYKVIYGHNASQGITINKNTIGIDTGCLYGNELTAYVLPDNRFISVPAFRTYVDYSQGGKYRMPR